MSKHFNSPKAKLAGSVGNLSDKLEHWACKLATHEALTTETVAAIGKVVSLKTHIFHADLSSYDLNAVETVFTDRNLQQVVATIDEKYGCNFKELLTEIESLRTVEIVAVH